MSKKTKSTESSTSSTNLVSTPTNPEWVTQGVQGVQGRINSLLDMDASTLVPGASDLQRQAFAGAQGLGQASGQGFADASDAVRGLLSADPQEAAMASAGRFTDVDMGAYQNPFTEGVVDTTLSGFDRSADRVRAQQALDMARGQRFGGSRSAITASMTEGELAQQRAAQEAQLRAAGFDRASGLAMNDLDRSSNVSMFNAGQQNTMAQAEQARRLQAAGLLGDLSSAAAGQGRADLGLMSDLGAQQRGIEGQVAGADVELTRLIAALNASQPYQLFRGETQTGTGSSTGTRTTRESDPMGTLGGILGGAGSLMSGLGAMGVMIPSDRRLKQDIKQIGSDTKGRNVYKFSYKNDPEKSVRIGHMAQEVEKTDPKAVKNIGGYRAIDYGLLEM